MTKKEAKLIASLVNSTNCYLIMVKDELKSPTRDSEKVNRYMDLHDEYALQLNRLLGVVATHTYRGESI